MLVDTGSVDCVFPLAIANGIGVTFIPPPPHVKGRFVRWRGRRYPLDFGNVQIELGDSTGRILEWSAVIGFSNIPDH